MPDQFSQLGSLYDETGELPFVRYLEMPSVIAEIGGIGGLAALDVGCGSGLYTRLLKRLGARRAIGIDSSEGMLATARRIEESDPCGAEYVHGDAADSAKFGSADLAFGAYLLPYARNFDELAAFCRGIANALPGGGRFVTLIANPDFAPEPGWYRAYGLDLSCPGERTDGAPITLTISMPSEEFSVTARYWSYQAHEQALAEAGFVLTGYSDLRPSIAGIAARGEEFWRAYLDRPHARILSCRRRRRHAPERGAARVRADHR